MPVLACLCSMCFGYCLYNNMKQKLTTMLDWWRSEAIVTVVRPLNTIKCILLSLWQKSSRQFGCGAASTLIMWLNLSDVGLCSFCGSDRNEQNRTVLLCVSQDMYDDDDEVQGKTKKSRGKMIRTASLTQVRTNQSCCLTVSTGSCSCSGASLWFEHPHCFWGFNVDGCFPAAEINKIYISKLNMLSSI